MSAPTSTGTADKAAETADAAKQSGQAVAGSAADHAKDLAGTASDKAADVLGEAKSQASDLFGTAREQLGSEAENRRGQAVSSLRAIGDELDSMQSHDGDHGVATQLAGRGGRYVRQTADWLDGRQPSEILDDVRRFARERPGTFLLGALVAGIVAGRLTRAVKAGPPPSSSAPSSSSNSRPDTGSQAGWQQDLAVSAPFASSQGLGNGAPDNDPAIGYDVDGSGYPPVTDDLTVPVPNRPGAL